MQDQQDKSLLQVLTAFMILALLGSVLVLISALITDHGTLTSSAIAALVGTITCLILLRFLHRKQIVIPAIVLPSVIYLLAIYLIFTGKAVGIRDEAALLFSLVVAVAGLLLGRRGVVVFGILSVLAVSLSVYAEISGVLVNQIDSSSTGYDTLITVATIYSLAFAMMYILVNMLTHNLAQARENQSALTQTNQQLQHIRDSLELQVQERTAALEGANREAFAARQSAENQTWLVTGQAQLAEQMRGELTLTSLANNIVRYICRYTDAQAGLFFIKNENLLHLMGRYAYTEHAEAKATIALGEGLIGQAARDQKSLVLHQIPENALMITSGLGESRPSQLLITPLAIDGRVIGVLELATLNEFTADHQTFIARSAESIAIAIQTAQARERIATLLLDSQQQAEELQAQEEELRSANEELHAQAESRTTSALSLNRQSARQP